MVQLDLNTARALVEAGYMPLSVYLDMVEQDPGRHAPLVPSDEGDHQNAASLLAADTSR